MNKEKYIKWKSIDSIPNILYLEGLHDDCEGFRILLRGTDATGRVLRVNFESILSYRCIDEGDYFVALNEGAKNGLTEWPLYVVDNSSYKNWFDVQNDNLYEDRQVAHYAVYTQNECIDILSLVEPELEWL